MAKREKLKLVSTAGTGDIDTTEKNKINTRDDLVLKKYDPVVNKHVEFKEKEMDSGRKKG